MSDNTSSSQAAEAKLRFDFIARVHVYTHDYIRFADTKASAILAACGFLFTGLLTRSDAIGAILSKAPCLPFILIVMCGLCGIASLLFTAYNCAKCIMPRLGSEGMGLVFWNQVAKWPDYSLEIKNLSSDVAIDELSKHVKAVAKVAHEKYVHVNHAVWGLCVTLISSLILSLLFIWVSFIPVSLPQN